MTTTSTREMKDSGVDWISEVPINWRVAKVGHLFDTIGSGTTPKADDDRFYGDGIPWVTTGELRETQIDETSKQITAAALEEHSALKVYPAGSLVLALYGATIGRLGFLGIDAAVNQACCVMTHPRGTEPRFVFFAFQAFKDRLLTLSVGGSQPNIGQDIVRQFRLLVPPIAEQISVVKFLDRETAQIDALIGKQQQLIETLAERRKAVITRAVTRGLDPTVPMKDSGVEWLGDIPASWTLKRFKDANLFIKGGIWGIEPVGDLNDIWCVRMADFDRHKLTVVTEKRTLRNVAQSERINRVLRSGDLVLEKSGGGDTAPVGTVVRFEHIEPAVCSNFACILRVRTDQDSKFWTYVHHAAYVNKLTWRSIKQTSGIQNLDTDSYFNERIGFPPLPEQQSIVAFLDGMTETIDSLIEKAASMVDILKERRQALISAAVTGKIDVRGEGL